MHILLVEDKETHAELIRRAFEPLSRRVNLSVARNLREARARLTEFMPDLMIIDLHLPDGQGLKLLSTDEGTSLPPAVILTSHGNERVAVDAMKAGALDYVVKSETTLADMPRIAERAVREWHHILERQRAEDALRLSEERYRELFENAHDIVYTHDLEGNFTSLNRAAERLTGYTRDEASHMNVVDIVAPEQLKFARQMIANTIADSQPTTYELHIVPKEGHQVVLEVSSRLVYQEGKPVGVQGIGRDITERKRLEAQLSQAQKMEAIGTLAGGIAHDFNNILAAILGYTELALYDLPQENSAWHYLQDVLKASSRAEKLVRQILTFSRQTEQNRQPVQLHKLVHETLTLLAASLPSTIEIRQHVSEKTGIILADPTQIYQALLNLCTNAEHGMRQTGGILEIRQDTVEVDRRLMSQHPELKPGSYIRLTIRDTGHGMSPEIMERIFEPFFTTKVPGEGTGMGLALVHGIVTSHGGMLRVESVVGQGSTFELYFPRFDRIAADDVWEKVALPQGEGCILFVDDEESLALLGQEILTRFGYDVVMHTSSVEALEAFRAVPHRFDLVITDQTMPNMSGETLARALRRIRPDIPIILCTGFSHVMNAEKARALGINAFCMKPLIANDLVRVIQSVIPPRAVLPREP